MKISVCITAYNQEKYIVQAIESVLAQIRRPDQIVIVDDCSSDSTCEIISDYHTRYPVLITPIYHTQNVGIAQTRVDALRAVSGDYVTFLDGDDYLLPGKLEKESLLLQNSDADFVFSNYFYIDRDGEKTGIWAETPLSVQGDIFQKVFSRDFSRRGLYRSELVIYQRWQQIGFYDPQLSLYEDYEMRIRLSKTMKAAYCHEPLSVYRLHESGLSRSHARQHVKALFYIYDKDKCLLDDLAPADRAMVNKKLMDWIAPIAFKAITQVFRKDDRRNDVEILLILWRHAPLLVQAVLRRLFTRRNIY